MTLAIEAVLDKYGCDYDPGKGGNQQVKCPFHEDTHASASVNLDKGLFNCYGCAVAGDGIELLMDQEGLEFLEAKRLAEELAGQDGRQVPR
jgi:DNA primase